MMRILILCIAVLLVGCGSAVVEQDPFVEHGIKLKAFAALFEKDRSDFIENWVVDDNTTRFLCLRFFDSVDVSNCVEVSPGVFMLTHNDEEIDVILQYDQERIKDLAVRRRR